MPIKLNTASGGGVILQGANTASDKTITIPADDGTMIYANSSGNVGIGSSTPPSYGAGGKTLLIAGSQFPNVGLSATASSTGNKNYRWIARDDANGGPIMQFQTTDDSWGSEQNIWFVSRSTTGISYQSWYTGAAGSNAERMRIDSSGNLLVGTTSAGGTGGLTIAPLNSGGATTITWDRATTTNTTVAAFFRNAGTQVGRIEYTNTATTYTTTSDYRLKHDIRPMQNALAKVAALKPCTYKWNADGSNGEGFIAHELAEVCPKAVTGEKNAVNEDGSINPQGIDTSFLVATLTAAIQELKAEVDSLRAQVEAK